jgi:hypothetical protein
MNRNRPNMRIEHQFEEVHIKLVWAELKNRFGFNVPEWKKKYFAEWNKNRADDEVSFFLVYMNKHINPLVNKILCRPDLYPTMNKLAEYVVNGPSTASGVKGKRN